MPTSDIFTGLNDTDILAMQQDTQSRLSDIFNNNQKQFVNPNSITQPEAPKGLYGTVNPGENINIDKTSLDYNAASYDTLAKKTQQAYPDSFKQLPDILLPQSETNRYTSGDFGFDVTRDNEDFYNGKQNAFAEIGKSVFARLPLLTISKLGTGIGYLLGLANPSNWGEKNYISSAADNSFAKFFEGMEDKVKNDWLPVYQSAAARNMGFFERAFKDQTFWAGDVTDAAAFMASAFVPGLGISKLGLGAKVAALAGMAEGEGLAASAEYLSQAGLKLARNVDVGLTTAANTASESMFEAKQVRDDVYKQLMATGQYTDDQAKNVAGEKARNSFLSNIVALSASNLWESNIMFKALGKKVEEEGAAKLATGSLLEDYAQKTPSTKVGKFLDGKLGFYGKKAAEGIGVEGFYEENIQQAIQRYNENSKNTNSNDGFLGYSAGILGQMWKQTKDSLSGKDKENAMNIGVGGLIGGLFGMPMSIISKEYSEHHDASKAAVDALNIARNNWLKIQDIYSVGSDGKVQTDYTKAAAVLFTQSANTDKLNDTEKAKNPVNREVAQKQLFASLVASHINNGSFDKLMDQMDQMKSWKPEDLVKLGFDTDKTGVTEKIQEYKRYADNIKELKEMIDKVKSSPKSEKGFDQYRKNQLFQLGSTREALETEAGKIGSKISQLESKIGRGDITDSFVNEVNSLKLRIASQQANIEESSDTYKPAAQKKLGEYEKELARLLKDNEETLKDLKSDNDGFLHYRNNDKNNHPLVNELHDSIVKQATLRNAIEDVSDEFNKHLSDKSYSESKYKDDIDHFAEYVKKAQEQSNNQDVEQDKELPEPIDNNQTQTSQTETSQTTQSPAPVQTETPTQTQVTPAPTTPIDEKQQKLKDLFNKYQADLNAATTPEEKETLKQKYIKGAVAINSEGKTTVSPKETARKTSEIKNLIPKGSTINKDELSKIFTIISNAVKNGEITPEQEELLTNILNDKKIVGTIFNTEEDLEDENSDVTDEENKEDENPDTEVNQNELDENLPDETNQDIIVNQDFDPNTNNIDTTTLDESDVSALAFMTSNKTVTQEENEDSNGRYNNSLDEDPYKQFIQGFLRYMQQAGIPVEGMHGKIIKDNDSLPHSKSTKSEIASGKAYGSVLVITNEEGKILYFDENYIGDDEKTGNSKPVVFSFTQTYWDSLKGVRAVLGEKRTGISAEDFLKMYQNEKEQQELARQLNDQGKQVNVEIKGISNGVIRKATSPVKASDVINESMNPTLYIPSAVDKYDPTNPDATKFVLVGSRALLNGALYAQMVDPKSGFISHVRLIPNLISDIPEVFEDIKNALAKTYSNKNEATLERDHLKDILFLGKVKRPTLVVTESDDQTEFNIRMIQEKTMIDPEATIDFVSQQRLNIKKGAIEEGGEEYRNFILNNSTTVDIPIQTSEGAKYIPLNVYASFDFLDSPGTMRNRLAGEQEHPQEIASEEEKEEPKVKTDSSTLTKTSLRKLGTAPTKSTEELAREQDEKDRKNLEGLKAIVDSRENLPLLDQNEIDHVNRIFGTEIANRVNEIVNSNARALWTTSGISLYRDARKGDGYHEAWHHFSQLYLTQNEKRSLYDEARKKNIDFTTRDGRKLNSKTASDFDIEEFMADDFRDYVLSDGKSRLVNKPYRNNIFRRILDFIKKFFFGDVNIAKLYDDLSQGNLYSYTPSINNAMWGKLNSRAVDKNGNEIVDNQKAAYYRDLVDYHMGEQLLAAKTSIESLRKNRALTEAIYTNIYNDLVNRYYNPMLDKADKGEQINQQVAEDLFNILSNWEAFVNYHKEASKLSLNIRGEISVDVPENPEDVTEDDELGGENYEIKEENDEEFGDDSVDKDVIQSDKLYDVAGNEQSSIQAASVQTRGLIRMLPAVDYDGGKFTVQLDVNGFPRLNDYARTWNNIAYELADLSLYGEMIQKLTKPDVQKKIPEVVALLRHLPDPNRTHTPAEINTILAFRTDFNRANIGIFSGKMYPNGSYYMNEETKRNNEQVKKIWTANFFNKLSTDPDVSGERILIDEETGKYYLNPSIVLSYNMATLQGREDLMRLIGMNFSDEAKKNAFYTVSLPNWLKEIQNSINVRHQNGLRVYNPTFDVRGDVKDPETGNIILRGLSQVMEGLTNFQASYAADVPSMSYQTAEGETIHGLSLNHTLSIITNKINKANSLDDIKNDPTMQHLDQANNPNVRGSIFLRSMFGINGNRIKGFNLVLGNYNGFKIQDKDGNTVGYSTTSLNVRQKLIFDISSLLSRGVIEVMRTESSKSAFFIKLNRYATGDNRADQSRSYLPISFSELPAGFESPKLMGYMIDNYLNDELVRMKGAVDVDVYKTDPELMKMAQGFNLFRDILRNADKDPESLKNDIKSDLETKSPIAVIQKHRVKIEEAVVNFFNDQLRSFKETLAEENITSEDLPKNLPSKAYDQQLRTFIANDFLLNVEYTKLFNGDTIYQAHYKDYFKRSKGDISTGKSPMTDDLFVRHMQSIEGNTFSAFIGSTIPNDYKTFRTLNFKDDKRDSKYIEIYRKDLLASDPKLDPAEIDRWLEKYKNMNVADGQGYITLDFYRQFLKSINNWSDDQEMGYQVELAKYRLANKDFNQDYTNEMKERDREFLKTNSKNFSYYPPLKIQYNGPIKAKGTGAMVMDKFSVVPMIPSMLQGTPLEQMNNEMLKAGIHYAKYESGTKKYKHPPIKIYNEDGFSGLDLSKHEPAIHFLDYLKEQINTNPKIKEESIFGSQIRKLIEANIFSSGNATPIDIDRHNRYKSYLKGIADLGKKELFTEIGLKEQEGRIRIGDMEKFISTVQRQADLRELNDNIKDYIQMDQNTKKLKYALETSLNRKPIQDLLMGLVDRRLRVQKLSGDQLIQISSSGYQSNDFKYTNATDEEIKKYGTNGLRFYHLNYDEKGKPTSIQSAQVKVALIGSFTKLLEKSHPDGNKIGTLERLNELLKNDDWVKDNQKSITLVGYRIPTQGHNSMENLQVAEFLPPHAGSVVIVPAEIVAKSGSDFDIDKLSIFRPSFNDKGELLDDETKEGYSNKIIGLFSEILSDPKIFKSLIRPNDTDLVKPETNAVAVAIGKRSAADAKEAKPYSGTQIYRYKSNLRKFETLLSAKRLLGIFAVNNTFTTVMQQAGTQMNMTYGISGVQRMVKLLLMSPAERAKVVKNGKLDLANKYSVDGTFKQDYYSQLINATVDAASDDFFGYVNMSYENVNVLCHLINQGVPYDRAIWFLNQPVLLRYYSDMRRKEKGVSRDSVKATILGELMNKSYFKESDGGRVILNKPLYNKDINGILSDPKYANLHLTTDTLKKYTKKIRDVDAFIENPVAKSYNAIIFSYFITLQEQAQLFRDLQRVSSYDTVKTSSPTVAYSLFATTRQIKANMMFDAQEVNNIADRSVIGAFDNKGLVAMIGAALMPVAFNPYFMDKSVKTIQDNTQYATKTAAKRFINNYETQWIEYVVKSLGKIGDYSLPQYAKYLQEGRYSLGRRFNDMISKYPDLKQDYAFVNKLRPNFPNTISVKKSNMEIYRLFENTTDDQNRYISEFRNLINQDSPKYTADQNKEIHKFFKDLAILGFIQSGFSKSNISFQELVPYEELADMFKTTVDNFTRNIAPDKTLLDSYIAEFQSQFNNNQNGKKQPWRGRDYFLSENINKGLKDKGIQFDAIKSQVNTQSKPQAYENTIQQKFETKPQSVEQEVKEQQKLLAPEAKTERQYWPGNEVPESGSEMEKAVGKADFKYMMDQISKNYIQFDNPPDEITKENYDRDDDYSETLTSENFERAVQQAKKFDDRHIFNDTNGDEADLEDIRKQLSIIPIGSENSFIEYYGGLSRLMSLFMKGNIDDQDLEQVEKLLADYGLLKYRDYNPNQLKLFSDEEYEQMLKDCKG